MRPLLVLIIAIVILGGVQAFLSSGADGPVTRPSAPTIEPSAKTYDIELILTFNAGADAFSVEDSGDAPSLLVQLNGQKLLQRTDAIDLAESPLLLRDVTAVAVGRNELFVQASPATSGVPAALRVRILTGLDVLAETTLWAPSGGTLQGTLELEVSE